MGQPVRKAVFIKKKKSSGKRVVCGKPVAQRVIGTSRRASLPFKADYLTDEQIDQGLALLPERSKKIAQQGALSANGFVAARERVFRETLKESPQVLVSDSGKQPR